MTLQIEYRPDKFEHVEGNEVTIASLKTVLEREKPPHVFLFTGPSGCGKTTLARIVRKELKCHKADYFELDAADFRGIETVREIRKKMHYKASQGPCRVWLLDECHQLTKDAQEALLKALEDTPSHVFFILATTEPEKLKTTLKRRCTEFSVKPLNDKLLIDFLSSVAEKKKVKIPGDVLYQIALDSLGSPGIALGILDKIIDLDKDQMMEVAEQSASEQNESIELCRALIKKASWKSVSSILKGIQQDPESVRRAVIGYSSAVLLNSGSPQAAEVLDNFNTNFFNSGKAGLVLACFDSIS